MSVINKMLRDLDQRQSSAKALAPSPSSLAFARDTQTVTPASPRPPPVAPRWRTGFQALLLLGVGALGAAGAWFYQRQVPSPVPASVAVLATTAPALAATPAAMVPLSGSLPERPPQPTPLTAPSVAVANPVAPHAGSNALPAALAAAQVVATPAPPSGPAARQLPSPEPAPTRQALPTPTPTPTPKPTPPQPTLALTSPATPPLAAQPAPAQDVLAQAQVLWRTGSPEGAIALLQNALATLERAGLPAGPVPDNAPLAGLVRELARLEVQQGRPTEALAMLTRLEPALSGVADLWASRGNAAQRLAQHAQAAHAYRTALALRPTEPRWMLGLAVSQAAQGELVQAAEWAEKARQAGALGPEVAAYLRELGVPLRSR